jgi:hypothetical protein
MEAVMTARCRAHAQPQSPADLRLPWWALALPVLTFAVLLLVVAHPTQTHTPAGDPALGTVVDAIRHLLPHTAS